MSQPINLLSFTVNKECTKPIFFRGSIRNSIVIAKSEFQGLSFSKHGLVNILRTQFPKCNDIINCFLAHHPDSSTSDKDNYIEIGFDSNSLRTVALISPFKFQGRLIKMYKTTFLPDGDLYRVYIRNINMLENSLAYLQDIRAHLEKFGTVDSLHLHHTRDGGELNGDGCATMTTSPDSILNISTHPTLDISYEEYPVIS